MALVAYDSSDESLRSDSGDDDNVKNHPVASSSRSNEGGVIVDQYEPELEDIVKPSENELAVRSQVAKTRKPVQIFLPSLSQVDPDSDEDKTDVKKIKTVHATGKCGLFSVLPPPATATQLIPHKLNKTVVADKSEKKIPSVKATSTLGVAGSTVHAKTITVYSVRKNVGVVKAPRSDGKIQFTLAPDCGADDKEDEETSSNFFALGAGSDLRSSVPVDVSGEVLHFTDLNEVELAHELPSTSEDSHHYNASVYNASPFNPQVDEDFVQPVNDGDEQESASSSNFEEYLHDEQFIRLCGRKLNPKQAINIIDVNADEQLRDVDLTKSLTEETTVVMSHSKKRNKDLPSSQQKRKHQITYLAYKAKEREMELKNQWAENKFNKRQTQSKYGF